MSVFSSILDRLGFKKTVVAQASAAAPVGGVEVAKFGCLANEMGDLPR